MSPLCIYRVEMRLLIVQLLSLLAVTVTSSQFSHVIIQQPKDVNSCGHNEQVLAEIQATMSQIQKDVAELKTGGEHTPPGTFRTCKTHFSFGKKCAHFSALYYVNALYVFLGSNLSFNW